MPMFDERSVRSLPGPEEGRAEVFHWDDTVRGLGLRVRSSGRRSWVVQLRIGARQRRMSLGSVDNISLKEARRRAGRLLAEARLGNDPRAEIDARKAKANAGPEHTFKSFIELYIARDAEPRLRDETLRALRHSLLVLAKPLHGADAAKISRRDLADLVQRVAAERGPRAADVLAAYLSAMFNWAIRASLTEANPANRLPRAHHVGARERTLTDAELAAVWHAVDGRGDYADVVRLLILTGQRRDEVGAMRRSEIDLERAVWTLPAERVKNGRTHDVPLSDSAKSILAARPKTAGRDLVFGKGAGGFSGWSRAKGALDQALTLQRRDAAAPSRRGKPLTPGDCRKYAPPPWRLHDLRRTAVTGMAELGVLPHVVEAVVNHVSGHRAGVAGIYNRATYAAEKRAALDRWAQHVEQLVAGRASNVIPLRREASGE